MNDIKGAVEAKLDWITLDAEDGFLIPLADDVQIVNFGSGHAHGMLGLLLKTKQSAPKLLISDVLYSMENAGPPVRLPGIAYDSLGYLRSIKAYQRLAKETGAEVWYGHDQAQWGMLKKSSEGYYE
jgi:glyoxylase-like metal-dependent hydrolase (beta-lactamase superfamily II)